MKRLTNECKNQIRKHRHGTARFLALFLAMAMVVSLGVDMSTTNLAYATERTREQTPDQTTYTCGKDEHTHSIENDCYALTCGKEETEGHEHTAECYDFGDPTCGIEETDGSEGHTHTLDCYDGATPDCGETESDGHKHTEECYNLEETICGKDEHQHTSDCLNNDEGSDPYEDDEDLDDPDDDTPADPEGPDEHIHTLDCYDNKVLTCTSEDEDHEHTLDCYDLGDPTCEYAEVDENDNDEDGDDKVEHTANADYDETWIKAASDQLETDKRNDETRAQALADLASSQAGYTAQILDADAGDEDAEPLYSLYSNWYTNGENSTKAWNTTFVFWTLDKAGFDTEKELDVTSTALPIRSDISAWIKALVAKQDATLEAEDAYDASLTEDDEDANRADSNGDADTADDAASGESSADADKTAPVHALTIYVNTKEDGLSLTAGDILFLDLDENGKADHVGVAASVDSDEDTDATNSVAIIIGDLDQDTLADLDETNDALDEDNSEADVVAGIALPADDYDWDNDGEDARQEYLESYIVGYIPVAAYEQQLDGIANGSDTDDGTNDGNDEDDDDTVDIDLTSVHGTTYTSSTRSQETKAAIKKVAQSPVMLADANDAATGVDMSSYISSVVFEKKDGVVWREATSFNTSDQVRGSISFENIYTSTIAENGNKIYIDLPAGIDCSRFEGKSYESYDGRTKSGNYVYEKTDDGNYRIVLTLTDDYMTQKAGDTIGGNLEFEFYWDEKVYPRQDKYDINIGDWDGEIEIIPDSSEKKEDQNANYSIYKESNGISYNDDGTTAYITYTVTLGVKTEGFKQIDLKDILMTADGTEGISGFIYDTAYGIQDDSGNIKANYGTVTSNKRASITVWPDGGNATVPVGTYRLTYRIMTDSDISDPDKVKDLSSLVRNKVQVPEDGDNPISSETWTTTTKGTVDKTGKVVSGSDATYIDYTVYLNAGNIIANIKKESQFTDTLPDEVDLEGDVTVTKYNVKGEVVSTDKATVTDRTITYTIPTGQYYYAITYRTKVKDSAIPMGGSTTIENTGTSTGGIDGSKTSETTVDNHKLKKYFDDQSVEKDSNGNWIDRIKWHSTINVKGSLEGYVYEDWGLLTYDLRKQEWFAPLQMSDAQRSAIYILDASGKRVDSSKYTVTTSDHSEEQYTSGKWQPIANGLYKITFTSEVTGPVTIYYETTADLSRYQVGDNLSFTNKASLTKDGQVDEASAQTTTIQYQHENVNVIKKYGNTDTSTTTPGKGTITLEPGQTSIPWTISINEGRAITTDVTVTDTLPEDLTFIPESFKVVVNGWDTLTSEESKNHDKCKWSYDETTRTITVKVDYDAFKADPSTGIKSYPFVISYRTELPESYFTGSDMTYVAKNTATAEANGAVSDSTYEQTVSRKVVGKNGTYDDKLGMLTYQINVNPDGAPLNQGNALKVEDTLTTDDSANAWIMESIKLESLALYTSVKEVNKATGDVTIKAGNYIRDLNEVQSLDSIAVDEQYYYDDTSKTFTTWVSDKTAYVIVATYSVSERLSDAGILMKNTVKLTGSDSWEAEDKKVELHQDTGGTTYTQQDTVTVTKHDTASYSTLLSDAEFALYAWDTTSSDWTTFGTIKTDSTGAGTATEVQYNTLYRLSEIRQPEGYQISDEPTYFIIVREANKDNVSRYLPESVTGDNNYSTKKVKVYTVKDNKTDSDGNVTKKYYANIYIDRYDDKDTTITEPGQLRVNKVWVGSDGTTITDPTRLANMPTITIELVKHAVPSYTVTFKGSNGTSKPVTVTKGQHIEMSWDSYDKSQFSVAEGTATISWGRDANWNGVLSVTDINGNVTISVPGTDVTQWFFSPKATGTASTDVENTPIKDANGNSQITLTALDGYTYLYTDLERGDGITYTLTETTVDGYTTTYKVNSGDLTSGVPTFSLNIDEKTGDTVTITNTAQKTRLKVVKKWADAESDHSGSAYNVKIYLVKNDVRTEQYVELGGAKWEAWFEDLPTEDESGNKITYAVEEDPVPGGYESSVEYGKTDATTDPDNPDNQDKLLATVTNTKLYSMPETGGSGTLMFYTFGAFALMVSLLGGYSMRRRDERRER